ncbi:MAG: glycine dehydrogenase, partial [Verrucomicrobia bacterium 21-51-4]
MEATPSSAISPREFKRHYISASDDDIQTMLRRLGLNHLDNLFAHIPSNVRFGTAPGIPAELSYERVKLLMQKIAAKNARKISFIGDGLMHYRVHPIVPFVSNIRGLTTAYTPYQPERSQGTLLSHWIYQSMMAELTGFEAINSSLYDRASALYEGLSTAIRLNHTQSMRVLLCESILPQDLEVVRTLARHT